MVAAQRRVHWKRSSRLITSICVYTRRGDNDDTATQSRIASFKSRVKCCYLILCTRKRVGFRLFGCRDASDVSVMHSGRRRVFDIYRLQSRVSSVHSAPNGTIRRGFFFTPFADAKLVDKRVWHWSTVTPTSVLGNLAARLSARHVRTKWSPSSVRANACAYISKTQDVARMAVFRLIRTRAEAKGRN